MRRILGNWGEFLVNNVVHPFAIFATASFIMILLVYFVVKAFGINVNYGVRTLAGALFSLTIMTYLFAFQKELLAYLGKINVMLMFIISFVLGIIIMVLISSLGNSSSGIPMNEIVLSGSFSILVFNYVRENKMLSFYYLTISGFLFYIIFGVVSSMEVIN